MRLRAPFIVLGLGACVSLTPAQRIDALVGEGERCDSFTRFDTDVRRGLDEAMVSLPGEALVSSTARLHAARLTCAKKVLRDLGSIRMQRGLDTVQAELDAMAMAFDADKLRALVEAECGAEASSVKPLAELAIVSTRDERTEKKRSAADQRAFERHTPKRDAPVADAVNDRALVDAQIRSCAAGDAAAGLQCLVELAHRDVPKPALATAADALTARRLAELSAETATRARELAALIDALKTLEAPSRAMATQAFEETCRRAAVVAADALRAGFVDAAAWVAAPCGLARFTSLGVEKHQALTAAAEKAKRPAAAALHAMVAASFGGAPATWPEPEPGSWDLSRVQCSHPIEPPTAPPGIRLRLSVRCERPKKRDAPAPKDGALTTFDGDADLSFERVSGDVYGACGGTVLSWPISVRDPVADESALGTDSSSQLQRRLAEIISLSTRDCQAATEKELITSCAKLDALDASDLEERFTAAALRTRVWPECFQRWFRARYRIDPPPLR